MTQLFNPGKIVATPGAAQILTTEAMGILIRRYVSGDWGEAGKWEDIEPQLTARERELGAFATSDDGKLNAIAILANDGSRIMGVYAVDGEPIWIIGYLGTPNDYTTILLPSEY